MKSVSIFFVLLILFCFTQCQSSSHPSKWSDQKLDEWFESGEFLNGLQMLPNPSIDRRSFAEHYYEHKDVWNKAFDFLKNANLAGLPLGRSELGDNMYVTVSEYFPKERETTLFEAHRINIDIHYVVSGKEAIDVAPLESMTVTESYNPQRDLVFGTVPEFTKLKTSPGSFLIIFPSEAHRPSVKEGNDSIFTRKIVMKFPMK
jgi:YhcH/YjgK/YiaL family protein